jgi:mono/diheme cytochrome c family protein
MLKLKRSPSPKKSIKRKAIGGTGCLIVAVVILVGIISGVVAVGLGLAGLLPTGQTVAQPPGLEDDTSAELVQTWREAQQAQLNAYGWVDQEAGVVHLPIDRAMALIAESGLPVGSPTPTEEPATATPVAAEEHPEETAQAATPTPEPEPTATPAPTVDLANVSFQNNVLPIFQEHCAQCHGGEDAAGEQRVEEGLNLLNYDDALAGSWNGSVIEAGDVEGSYLIEQVVTGRMPKRGERLSDAEIEVISAWVEAGALNN